MRIAFIGLDHWYSAVPLARAFAARDDVEVAGIADRDEARARQIAEQVGVADSTADAARYLDDPTVDVVANFTSTERSAPVTIAAARRGKAILSVKPLANTLAEATEVVRAVTRAGVTFVGADSRPRAFPFSERLRDWHAEGRFGTLLTASYRLGGVMPEAWPGESGPGWWGDPERAPGGAWIDHAIYHLDLFRWLTGAEVTRVSGMVANLRHHDLGVEDYGHATVEFSSGLVATVEDTWVAPPRGAHTTMTLVGTEGALSFDSLTGQLSLSAGGEGWTHAPAPARHVSVVDDLVAVFRGEREPHGTVADAWHNLAACRAFYEAAATGTPVTPEALPVV